MRAGHEESYILQRSHCDKRFHSNAKSPARKRTPNLQLGKVCTEVGARVSATASLSSLLLASSPSGPLGRPTADAFKSSRSVVSGSHDHAAFPVGMSNANLAG